MDAIERAGYLAHSAGDAFRRRLASARDIVRETIRLSSSAYVSLSCGKDSVAMSHLVLEISPKTPLRFLSSGETRLLHNVDKVIDWFGRAGASVEEVNVDRVFSADWKEASWQESRKAGANDLQRFAADRHDAAFLGLRAQESRQRRMSLYGHKSPDLPQFIYRLASGRLRSCPLAEWRTEDVGAYVALHCLPLLDAYHDDRGLKARTTARLTGSALRAGELDRLKRRDRAAYAMLVRRWPELAAHEGTVLR